MSDIKVGDTVKLKSGGPKMTVDSLGKAGIYEDDVLKAWVSWFDNKNMPQSESFPVTSLKRPDSA